MEKEKKKGSFGKVLLVIILLIAFAVAGWFGNDFYRKKVEEKNKQEEKKNTKKEEEKDEELDKNSDLVQKLFKKVTLNGEGNANCHKNWIYGNKDEFDVNSETDENKMNLVAINMDVSKKQEVACSEISIPDKKDEYYSNDCSFVTPSDKQVFYDRDYVESIYKDIYGKEVKFNSDVYINSGEGIVRFYPVENKYYKYTVVSGSVCGPAGYTEAIEKAEKVGKEIKIYEAETYNEEGKEPVVTKYVYTFSKQDDGSYGFVSRKKTA